MSNLVLYRKYRPKSWNEVIGQEHVVRTLTNALKLNRVGHAYLFTGPRGTGKTTLARLLAKSLNCEELRKKLEIGNCLPSRDLPKGEKLEIDTAEPCNKCGLCNEIAAGKALDLIEIDAASNRGIDEIRQLRDGIKFAPAVGKFKVFIIDEVHMLTKEAFNALLKTLEEPPSHAIFILATTEVHKVPATILSRVQRFDFRRLSVSEILKRLSMIAGAEKIKIDEPTLKLVSRYAQGSSRDAESMLEQLKSWGSAEVKKEDVESLLGVVDFEKVKALTDFVVSKNPAGAVDFIGKMINEGRDLQEFLKEMQNHFRRLMILKIDPALSGLISQELTQDQVEASQNQANSFELQNLSQALHILHSASQDMKFTPIPPLPLELAVVEIIQNKNQLLL